MSDAAAPRLNPRSEIRSLTGLRGCAAVMVMLYHFSLNLPPGTLPLQSMLRNGYLFVDLFFVLSGFVMAYSQRGPFETGYRPGTHLAYLAARLARVYPLYALVTLESFAMLAWRGGDAGPFALGRTLLLNLALVQAWGLAPSLEGATWSISTEWGAYLMFPVLLAVTVSGSRPWAALAGAAAMGALAALAVWPAPLTFAGQGRTGPLDIYSAATAMPLIRCIAEFTLGLLTFRVARHWTAPARTTAALSWATVAALALLLACPGCDLGVVALFPVLILALVPQAGAVGQLLASRVPYRLGQWSYAIYLIHDKFSHLVAGLRDGLAARIPLASCVAVVAIGGVVIALGATTFVAVELPLRRMVLRWVGRGNPAPREPSSAALAQP